MPPAAVNVLMQCWAGPPAAPAAQRQRLHAVIHHLLLHRASSGCCILVNTAEKWMIDLRYFEYMRMNNPPDYEAVGTV